ncbi:MAG: beta-glucosidase [Kosmotogaceae bacterium]|nr:beta-glucosidase [Kosmotogaceae bacterium]
MAAGFPEDFLWGVATAAYQIEGADLEEGKGPSIWSDFSHRPGRIDFGESGDVACDHYHRFKEDIDLMTSLGLNSYRFSISWPRVLPKGRGTTNQKGIDFYDKLVDELLEREIQPVVTLYHWDLPLDLQVRFGGWECRDISHYFADYSSVMFYRLGDRVKYWITLNEPYCSSHVSYLWGEHAPGKRDLKLSLSVAHNLLLSHGEAVRRFREEVKDGLIGLTNVSTLVEPATDSKEDLRAAKIYDQFINGWFFETPLTGEYPSELSAIFEKAGLAPIIESGDMEIISVPFDFWGVNYYTRNLVRREESNILGTEVVQGELQKSEMGWEIYPEGLEAFLFKAYKEYGKKPIYITENGIACKDKLLGGSVDDHCRIEYLRQHFSAALNAIKGGVDLRGYFVWTLMDNFEWARGFSKRFGLVYVDYNNDLKRIPKKSFEYYRDFIGTQ